MLTEPRYSAAADVNRYVDIAHFTIALFTPSGNLLRSLLLTFNEFSLLCDDRSVASYAGAITVYGGPILYLIVQTILLMLFLIWWDSGWKPAFLVKVAHKHKDVEQTEDVDHEVFTEAARIDSCTDELRVSHVTKVYGDNLAVDDITFGVPHGEVFALLGPNGAGKSTTISMVRGDIRPTLSEGDIMIEEQSIVRHRAAARNHLGVVPQFDAMDAMTTTEHLRFYARARGVKNVEHNVEQVLNAVGLASYRNRMAAKLSGGNKRKLSLGIALIGNPSVLLVDEGSSGMDAAAKRIMWRTLSSVSAGRSLVLTTHSMEEADALADRVGIMAKRMLALGTSDTLRKRHGDAYYVHLIHKDAPFTSEEDMASLKAWILSTFPYASVEERSFHGQIRFSVPNRASSPPPDYSSSSDKKDATTTVISTEHGYSGRDGISALFEALEMNKEKLGMEFYAVSQATLDQVFLNIVTKHNVEEENYRQEHQTKLGAWGKFKAGAKKLYHDA
ncbi:hypothetical protein M8818_005929 [Zalaria obscura]|uniref:Uncharacterized protein n=1 Tax=Zalaria obscura TaxID=2024903 RepID=A0ACC3S734_9PEZI